VNVKLLEKVRAAILAEPAQFVMSELYSEGEALGSFDVPRKIPNCGTAACVAGWAVTLGARFRNPKTASASSFRNGWMAERAEELLVLNYVQGNRLFYVHEWPQSFLDRWREDETLKGRARIAAERIDHFIATDGAE